MGKKRKPKKTFDDEFKEVWEQMTSKEVKAFAKAMDN